MFKKRQSGGEYPSHFASLKIMIGSPKPKKIER